MSHLQPKFIAKAKAQAKQSKARQPMSRSLAHREAARYHIADSGFGDGGYECTFISDHRFFALRS